VTSYDGTLRLAYDVRCYYSGSTGKVARLNAILLINRRSLIHGWSLFSAVTIALSPIVFRQRLRNMSARCVRKCSRRSRLIDPQLICQRRLARDRSYHARVHERRSPSALFSPLFPPRRRAVIRELKRNVGMYVTGRCANCSLSLVVSTILPSATDACPQVKRQQYTVTHTHGHARVTPHRR